MKIPFNYFFVLILLFILISCGDQRQDIPELTGETGEDITGETQTTGDGSQQDDEHAEHHTDGIRVQFPTGATEVTLNGKISGFGDNKTYVFEVSEGQKLNASVKPTDGDGNIRISQIISPSGKADGPFGESASYFLDQAGDWKLVLSEDQMAGDPWEGEYTLTIEIN